MSKFQLDWLLILPIFFLLILGITILQSIAPEQVLQQALVMGLSLLIASVIAFTNYRIFDSFSWLFYFLSLGLLIATFVIGQTTRGAVRWIPIGSLKLQTSELVKPLLIIFFAHFSAKSPPNQFKNLLASALLFIIPAFLIFRQPDLGSSLVMLVMWLGIVFAAGIPVKFLSVGLAASLVLLPFSWSILKDYQQARLITFVDPLSDPLQSGYNLIQSVIAVGSGRFLGRGLGQGTQSHLQFLPERHTDFVFASLAEELGLLGALILIGLFVAVLVRTLKAAQGASDRFGALLCFGIFSMLAFHIFINIGMNIGLVPITGITLPLISSGGSSLLSTLVSLGLVVSVSSRRKKPPLFEIH